MPTTGAKKITATQSGVQYEWHTTGAIDTTSMPGYEKFNGRRILPPPAETTDGAMWIQDSKFDDKKVEDLPS